MVHATITRNHYDSEQKITAVLVAPDHDVLVYQYREQITKLA